MRAHPQGEELEPARAKAEKMGIKQIFIEDVREEFVRDFVFPMFRCERQQWRQQQQDQQHFCSVCLSQSWATVPLAQAPRTCVHADQPCALPANALCGFHQLLPPKLDSLLHTCA